MIDFALAQQGDDESEGAEAEDHEQAGTDIARQDFTPPARCAIAIQANGTATPHSGAASA